MDGVLKQINSLDQDLSSRYQQDSFEEFCMRVNDTCKKLQEDPKEKITDQTAFMAYACVKNMRLMDTGDVLLFCAAMNLLNTYVKQKTNKLGYGFKKEIGYLFGISLNVGIRDVLIDLQMDGTNNLLVIEILGVQFSFHNIIVTRALKKICSTANAQHLEWDEIRKQLCANTLFEMVLANKERCCGETFRGKSLEKKLATLNENFLSNKITFKDL